jgi:HD domain-containing protein
VTAAGRTALPRSLAEALPAGWPEEALRLVERAYQVAAYRHRGQRRRSGDPYITHPVAVAEILAADGMDHEVVCAALLHDVVDDAECTPAALRAEFGDAVGELVRRVTAYDAPENRPVPEGEVDPDDARALMIKLADRLHNMRTIEFLPRATQERKSGETLLVFAPLARRLGRDEFGRRLEEVARGTLRRPAEVSGRALTVAVLLLPAAARGRWLEEWLGELHALPASARVGFVAQLLRGIPRLAITLRRGTAASSPVLRPVRWLLRSDLRTWSVLGPFVAWMLVETGRQNIGDAVAALITVPPVLAAGVAWLRARLGMASKNRP